MQARGSVWTDENIVLTIEEAERHYNEAKAKNMPIINTSLYTVEEVAEGLYYWVENILLQHGKQKP